MSKIWKYYSWFVLGRYDIVFMVVFVDVEEVYMSPNHYIRNIIFPDKIYLIKKFNDHRKFSIIMSILSNLGCAGLWIWDYVIDPIGANSTILLRILMLVIGFIYTLALKKGESYNCWVPLSMLVTTISWEIIFIAILNRLDTGMIYGISGFMYFLLLPLLIMQGLPTRINILYIIMIATIPQILAMAGIAQDFHHKQYAVLVWSEAVMSIIVQIAVKSNYVARYNAQLQLELNAITDGLTGVGNRTHFITCWESKVRIGQQRNTPLTLILLDIDDFKCINDTYGHPTGDKVIKQLADLCQQNIRADSVIARLGGEEFGILLLDQDKEKSVALAECIRLAVESTPVSTGKGTIKFTCSLGVAIWDENESFDHIYERVDMALYQAKLAGRNCVHVAE